MVAHWNGGSGGKGSAPRPLSVSNEEYANRWDAIFGRDIKEKNDDGEQDKITRSNAETQEAKKFSQRDS